MPYKTNIYFHAQESLNKLWLVWAKLGLVALDWTPGFLSASEMFHISNLVPKVEIHLIMFTCFQGSLRPPAERGCVVFTPYPWLPTQHVHLVGTQYWADKWSFSFPIEHGEGGMPKVTQWLSAWVWMWTLLCLNLSLWYADTAPGLPS